MGQNPLLRYPLGNWEVTGIFIDQSGGPGTFGNAGKNSLRRPDYLNLDVGLYRNFSPRRAVPAAVSRGILERGESRELE